MSWQEKYLLIVDEVTMVGARTLHAVRLSSFAGISTSSIQYRRDLSVDQRGPICQPYSTFSLVLQSKLSPEQY